MINSIVQSGHSALVKMHLFFNRSSVPIAQMGPDFIILEATAESQPCDAVLELNIDGRQRRWEINLPQGISTSSRTVEIARKIE
jgi:hypothetical protein